MTALELRSLLPILTPAYFADATYSKPTKKWLLGPFWSWFQARRFELGLTRWTRSNDCDNFARSYAQYCQDLHALTSDPKNSESLSVGEFWYRRIDGSAHAVVAAVTDEGLNFIEPQTGRPITLSEAEFSSCFFARF